MRRDEGRVLNVCEEEREKREGEMSSKRVEGRKAV